MIQMDIPAAFVCAQAFAWCGRDWLQAQRPALTGRYTCLATIYALGVIGVCGLYLYSGWTEWEMMYWLEPVRMDTANFGNALLALAGPAFLATLGLAGAGGFLLAHQWIRNGKPRRVLVSLAIGIALSLGMVLLTPAAPMFVGHYHDYHAYIGEAVSSGAPWQYGIIAIGPWKAAVPWVASDEFLGRHHLITFFSPRFFVPWAIDIVVFFASAVAVGLWFARAGPSGTIAHLAQPEEEHAARQVAG